MSKKLVAYFSASGITAGIAEKLAEAAGSDLYEIKPAVPYTKADLDWMDKQSRSSVEMSDLSSRPEISGRVENMDDYDVIFVGFPIWWYVAPTIILFATSGGSGFGKTAEKLADSCKGAVIKGEKLLNGKVDKDMLSGWIKELGV